MLRRAAAVRNLVWTRPVGRVQTTSENLAKPLKTTHLSTMPENTARLSTALADRYKIESHLGEGGMANVYLVEIIVPGGLEL